MSSPHGSIDFEKLYSVVRWVEDLHTAEGKSRFEKSIEVFKKIMEHSWVKELIERKRSVTVLDICGGTGIGGIALTKILQDLGVKVDLPYRKRS